MRPREVRSRLRAYPKLPPRIGGVLRIVPLLKSGLFAYFAELLSQNRPTPITIML
jgi:hypothetical protein